MKLRLGHNDHGAAAVEFALVLLPIILLIFGALEFGRAYNAQISLSAATREGVRALALGGDDAVEVATSSLPSHMRDEVDIPDPVVCNEDNNGELVSLTATYQVTLITGLFDPDIKLTGIGVMRCGG